MAREFYLGKTMSNLNSVLFVLLEKDSKGVFIEPFRTIAGGEKDLRKICKKLNNLYKEESKKIETVERIFTLSSIKDDVMTVDSDSGLMFIEPVSKEQLRKFYEEYRLAGSYS